MTDLLLMGICTQQKINSFISIPWDISNAVYENKSFDYSTQTIAGEFFFIKPDGTKLYIGASQNIYQYTLSTAWDISTAVYDNKSIILGGTENTPEQFYIKDDGLLLYSIGSSNETVRQFPLSTAWDISTVGASTGGLSTGSQTAAPSGLFFKSDGTKCYVSDKTNDYIYQYALSTSWDISTGTYDNKSLDVSSQLLGTSGIFIKPDGTKIYIIDADTFAGEVYQYALSTSWDISTGTYDNKSLDVSSFDNNTTGLFFKSDGTKFYINGSNNDMIYQYKL